MPLALPPQLSLPKLPNAEDSRALDGVLERALWGGGRGFKVRAAWGSLDLGSRAPGPLCCKENRGGTDVLRRS